MPVSPVITVCVSKVSLKARIANKIINDRIMFRIYGLYTIPRRVALCKAYLTLGLGG
jgi:hypothetical protein